ncbi:Heterokaryon incompatibility protein [Rutstroemia sp. NJR-2017a BVV2]|nr:Heterokaryon incompatibility protein [Rutstroemia sp. NJR-2017a BVV2]
MSLQYNTLDRSKHEIRLIRFLRNNKTPMEISLSCVFMDEHPQYHCLSYVWGNPTSVYPIVVDGVEILVNQNLGEAFQRIEGEDDVEFLWADALCINQKNEVEKMHQVQMMDRIYGEATVVLAWLGPEADSSGEVLDEVSRVGGIVLRNMTKVPYPLDMVDDLLAAGELSSHKAAMLTLSEINVLTDPEGTGRPRIPDCWDDIGWGHAEHQLSIEAWSAFFSRPYWRRVWILQELATARASYLLCGTRKGPLVCLCALLRFVVVVSALVPLPQAVLPWLNDFMGSSINAPILRWILDSIESRRKTKSDLLDLLRGSGSMDATVPQDRIFALSALTVDDQKIDLNYSKTLQEYLADIMRNNFLRLGFRLEPLNVSECPWASGSPSWVANHPRIQELNIIRKVQNAFYAIKINMGPHKIVQATPDFRAGGQVPWILSQQNFPRPDILRLPCQVLGRINRYSNLGPTEEDLERNRIIHDRVVNSPMPPDGSALDTDGINKWLVALSALQKLVSFLDGPDNRKLSDLHVFDNHHGGDQLVLQICSLILCPGEEIPDAFQEFYRERDSDFYLGFDALCAHSELFNLTDNWIEYRIVFREVIRICSYFTDCTQLICNDRFVFKTSNNHIGLGPDNIELGDYIVILPGTSTPQIARPVTTKLYELIGQIYIPGVMYGEGFNMQQNGDSQTWMDFC